MRFSELFGHVTFAKAGLRLISSNETEGEMIIRCNLSEIHELLVSIALTNPPMVALDISGSVSRLRNRRSLAE
jgi:RNase P/RNase MRP subunit POP5